MIEVRNLTKEFVKINKDKKKITFKADDNISFKASDGEIVGILGPNGAGKTTLLRMIAGIMNPSSGEVEIDHMTYQDHEIDIKKEMAFLSGNTKLYKDLSCYELLKMCGDYYGLSKEKIEKRISEVSKNLDLENIMNQRIGNMSTGQTQRVGLARCILHDPTYYVLDEATSGLDIISSKVILDFIKEERNRGKCILYSTHYMEEAENICDRVVMIHEGKVLKIDTPQNIVKETKTTNLRDAFFQLIGGSENE